jgi:hypothetical protein
MTALLIIALVVGAAVLAPKCGTEDRPEFNERRPLA